MTKSLVVSIAGLLSVGGTGFGAHQYLDSTYAKKEKVLVVEVQVKYVQTRQMIGLLRDINKLEEKPNKTQDDRDLLKYLRETLKEMQEVQRGEKK